MTQLLRSTLLALAVVSSLSACVVRPRGRPATVAPGGDHDRGHGNDADGHDEDNPGRGRRRR